MSEREPRCTIIIPTYNRSSYLSRQIRYYESLNSHFPIIISDSSHNESKQKNKQLVHLMKSVVVRYIEKNPRLDPYKKFVDLVNEVTTPYCIFCADDDFLHLPFLERAIRFLDSNPSYGVVQGNTISFSIQRGRINWRDTYNPITISDMLPSSRLQKHFRNYVPTQYAMHRTANLKRAYKELVGLVTGPVDFKELAISGIAVAQGKLKFLPLLCNLRDAETLRIYRLPKYSLRFTNASYPIGYKEFRASISKFLEFPLNEANKIVDQSMAVIMRRFRRRRFLQRVLSLLPRPFRLFSINVYRRLFIPWNKEVPKRYKILAHIFELDQQ
ncbi:TIGR00180 family glycosyltransferase [Candidatus Woesearchaeota archaeon]|nr:TIGR00180 family glycosyltransferase [Candidatus Woesearchaeota archaeon]